MALPIGTVTFLFTDIVGSTKLLDSLGDAYAGLLADHRDLLRAAFQKWNGHEVDTQGDSFFVAFPRATQAVSAAIEIQRKLNEYVWPENAEVRVRMGLHTGEPVLGATGYVGIDVHRAARISEVGYGGQVMLSATTEQLLRDEVPNGASMIYQGQHQLKDLSRPEHLFELRIHGLPSDFPPLRTLNLKRTNLSTQSTSFVGRTSELEDIFENLRNPSCRLLTLVGPGGIGKSRLALQAAARISDEFSDGTYFIPLETVPSPEFIITAIADGMNFDIDATAMDGTAEEQLMGYLSGRSMLLLLDNFEHVMEGALFLSNILERAPDTKLMVTSRERLTVKSEWVFEVHGLDHRKLGISADIGEDSAQALFMERALQTEVGYILPEGQMPHVMRICRLVEGMPLAIELAAAWVRMLTPEEIANEIERGIEFLSSSMKDLPSRHRSIQAVLDYSWQLLTDDEKSALRRLSVFQGGFTLSTGKDVAGVSIATIADLADKCQLKVGLEGRYEMHSLSRQYALSKLKEIPEEHNKVQELHAITYCNLLKEWEPQLKSGKRGEYLQSFSAEIGNVRAAWDWAISQKRADLIINALESLWLFYEIRNWFQEGFDRFKHGTTVFESFKEPLRRDGLGSILEKLLARQGWFAWRLGRYAEAQDLATKSLGGAIGLPSIDDQAFSRLLLGIVTYSQGELGMAKGYLDESLIRWREIEDRWGVATTLFYLGLVTHARGEFGDTQHPYQYGLELFKDAGYQLGATFSHTSVGRVVQTLGDFKKAEVMCEESLTIRREIGDSWGIAACLDSLGVLECGLGELDNAMIACLESLEIRNKLGDRRGVATSLNNLSHVAYLREEYDEAIRYCEGGLEIRRDLGNQRGIAASLNFLGTVTSTLDDHQQAKAYLLESLKIRKDLGDKTAIAESLNNLGSITLKLEKTDEGYEHFSKAFKIASEIGAIPLSLDALYGLAECFLRGGEGERAVEVLSVVAHHEACSQEIKSKAQEIFQGLLEGARDRSLQAAWKRGAESTIEEIDLD